MLKIYNAARLKQHNKKWLSLKSFITLQNTVAIHSKQTSEWFIMISLKSGEH